jgi:hypothetical protein
MILVYLEKTCLLSTIDDVVNSLARSTTNDAAPKAFAPDGGDVGLFFSFSNYD